MGNERILLIGVNHKTTPVEIREKIALSDGYAQPLDMLRAVPGCQECLLLSTCNRVEVLWLGEVSPAVNDQLIGFVFGKNLPVNSCRPYLYQYQDEAAVNHLFQVAASLDSMIVGEAQILGQLKEAYRQAVEARCTGPLLNRLLHKSFSVAKRVRSETGIGSSAVSISYAAVELAKKIFGSLQGKNVLLIGAGEMAELAMEHLLGQKIATVVVANRTLSRAADLAQRYRGTAISLQELLPHLEAADIVISSTGAAGIILEQQQVRPIMRARRHRPLFFIDIAVPRDLDPALNELENVYLYDIDDLGSVVAMNRSEREKEAIKARQIVTEETVKFMQWREGMALTPTIQSLRQRVDQICAQELDRTLAKTPELSAAHRQSLEKMLEAVTSKFLHAPLQYLKSDACGGRQDSERKIETVRTVFGLHGDGQHKQEQ